MLPPRFRLHRATLTLALLLLALALLAVLAVFSWQSEKADRLAQLRTAAELTEKAIDRYFVQKQLALAALGEDMLERDALADLPTTQRLLGRFKAEHRELVAVSLLDLGGQLVATSASTALSSLPRTSHIRDFAQAVQQLRPDRPLELARPIPDPVTLRWVLPLRFALRVAQGRPVGFLVASAPVEMLQSFWSEAPVSQQASIALVRDDGYLISRHPLPPGARNEEVYGQPRTGEVMAYLSENGYPRRGDVEGRNSIAGEPYMDAFARLGNFPVTVVAGMPLSQVRAGWWADVRMPLLAVSALGLVGLAVFEVLRRREEAWRSERIATEARLRASESFLERTGRLASVGGWAVDVETRAITWTRQTYRIHEVDETHRPTLENGVAFYPPEARPALEAALAQAMTQGTPWALELPFVTARGRAIWVRVLGEVEQQDGRPIRLVGAFQDVTDYRQRGLDLAAEQALRQQAEQHAGELKALLDERDHMLDVLAHEVRQPLHNASAALQSASRVLAEQGEREASARLARAHVVIGRVTGSIDNTLAVSSQLALPGGVLREDMDIESLLAVTVGDIPAELRERVVVERHTATRTVPGDMSLVRLALRNLIVNALRHGPAGTPVTVCVDDSDEPLALLIDVCDSGPGVPAALLPRLFDRGAHGGQGGHGLGLYIVRRVMERHGGRAVLLHNRPGQVVFRLVFEQRLDE